MDFQSTSLSNAPSPNLIFPKTLSQGFPTGCQQGWQCIHSTPPHSPQRSVPAQCRSCSTNGLVALEEEPEEHTVSEAPGWAWTPVSQLQDQAGTAAGKHVGCSSPLSALSCGSESDWVPLKGLRRRSSCGWGCPGMAAKISSSFLWNASAVCAGEGSGGPETGGGREVRGLKLLPAPQRPSWGSPHPPRYHRGPGPGCSLGAWGPQAET